MIHVYVALIDDDDDIIAFSPQYFLLLRNTHVCVMCIHVYAYRERKVDNQLE